MLGFPTSRVDIPLLAPSVCTLREVRARFLRGHRGTAEGRGALHLPLERRADLRRVGEGALCRVIVQMPIARRMVHMCYD